MLCIQSCLLSGWFFVSCPAAFSLMVFLFLHIYWGLLWFAAYEKSYIKGAIVLFTHTAASVLVSLAFVVIEVVSTTSTYSTD